MSSTNRTLEVGNISFKSEVTRNGEVENAKCIVDLMNSASVTGHTIPDFENLNFKIASGHRKIQTVKFKNKLPQPKAKGQSEKRSLAGRQNAWMIYDGCGLKSRKSSKMHALQASLRSRDCISATRNTLPIEVGGPKTSRA